MGLYERLERTRRLDTLIRKRATGSPDDLADRMGVSLATIYRWLKELKAFGMPVKYCRKRKTYYYDRPDRSQS
jgi:predicted DNA-binding transcriptional regulator YafY